MYLKAKYMEEKLAPSAVCGEREFFTRILSGVFYNSRLCVGL